jgi:hypothetical protein
MRTLLILACYVAVSLTHGAPPVREKAADASAVQIAGTNWQVTPPRGFLPLGERQWERAFGRSHELRETISAGTTIVQWQPGTKWDTTQTCFTDGTTGRVIEGNHYGHATFSYTCANDYAMEVFDLVSDAELPDANGVVRVIRLTYQGSPASPANPLFRKPAEKPQKPSLATFRRMQESLAPVRAASHRRGQ